MMYTFIHEDLSIVDMNAGIYSIRGKESSSDSISTLEIKVSKHNYIGKCIKKPWERKDEEHFTLILTGFSIRFIIPTSERNLRNEVITFLLSSQTESM